MGAQPTDRFEIGSISKGLTGLLFADMIKRGEVRTDTHLGELLPVSGELAEVRLSQLATHTSDCRPSSPHCGRRDATTGPPSPPATRTTARCSSGWSRGKEVPLDAPPGTYSNLAFELLGAALASAADRPYRDLLRERILIPVGLTGATVPYADAELTDADLLGQTGGGRTADAWLGEAMAPAGGVRADIDEMAVFTQRLLTGRSPGMDASTPKVTVDDTPTGWAWITMPSPVDGRPVTWHNGGTGGFTSFLGLDRERQVGVVIMSSRARRRTPPPGPGSRCWTRSGTAHDHRRCVVAARHGLCRRVRGPGLVAGTPGGQGAGQLLRSGVDAVVALGPGPGAGATARTGRLVVGGGRRRRRGRSGRGDPALARGAEGRSPLDHRGVRSGSVWGWWVALA